MTTTHTKEHPMTKTESKSVAVVNLDTPELEQIEASKAEQIRKTFGAMADMLADFEADYRGIMHEAANEEDVTPELSARARRLRLDIVKVRIEAEKRRVALKREYLLAGRAIDGTNNILKWAISQKEEALEAIEKIEERREAEQLESLQAERAEALAPYVEDAHLRDLSSMEPDVWEAYLATKQQEHEDRLEAERKAEEEREERERIAALDRERTRESAPYYRFLPEDSRDWLGALEEDVYAGILAAAMDAHAEHEAEQERVREENEKLARAKAAADRSRKAALTKARKAAEAERKRREEMERAEQERIAAEKKAEEERRKAEEEAAKAPVRERLLAWVDVFALPDLPGEEHEVADQIRGRFGSFREWARKEVGSI